MASVENIKFEIESALIEENKKLRALLGDQVNATDTYSMLNELWQRLPPCAVLGVISAALQDLDAKDAEIKALTDALQDCASGLRYIRQSYGDLYGVGWVRALGKAAACLNHNTE